VEGAAGLVRDVSRQQPLLDRDQGQEPQGVGDQGEQDGQKGIEEVVADWRQFEQHLGVYAPRGSSHCKRVEEVEQGDSSET